MSTPLSWFEIPTADFERGIRFYETVLGVTLQREDMGPMKMAMFPFDGEEGPGGALTFMEGGQPPGPMGSILYFSAGEDLSAALARVEPAGGAVIVGKTAIPPDMGYFAVFRDSEGNSAGLYSKN